VPRVRIDNFRGQHRGQHAALNQGTCGTCDPRNHAHSARLRRSLCARQESNLRPRAPEARALSPELRALWESPVYRRPSRWYVPAVDVSARIGTLELAETFVISRSARDSEDVVVVELRHSGVSGFGEAQPIDRYGETAESAQEYVAEHAELLGDDPFALEEVMDRLPLGEFAARAALDAALHDLQGKLLGQPAWRLLGLRRAGPPTSWTVWLGDPDDMASRAEQALGRFRRLKLKLGGGDGLDVERVRAVRGVAGDLPLQVDVNEAWTLEEALEALPSLAELGVEYCEQPLSAGDPGGPQLKERSPLPIYVDEDCHVLGDVAACAARAHGINVKLAKSGGIREAVRMVHAARALGLGCMLGCMIESGLGISAGAQIASLFDHVDLDGNLLLAHDPWPGVPFVEGVQLPPEEPGLGVHAVSAAR
jgi:L-Ala-D/L-Glu epimerase